MNLPTFIDLHQLEIIEECDNQYRPASVYSGNLADKKKGN